MLCALTLKLFICVSCCVDCEALLDFSKSIIQKARNDIVSYCRKKICHQQLQKQTCIIYTILEVILVILGSKLL